MPPAKTRLAVGALGVVFGDIGTSPLYAFRESFIGTHRLPIDPLHVLGVLSLIVWALILVVTVKYVLITMRADNRGEGGSFALLALISRVAPRARLLPVISAGALLATALFYGDAVITPAISILSAVEGMTLADARFGVVVLPMTLIITIGLFAIQYRGTANGAILRSGDARLVHRHRRTRAPSTSHALPTWCRRQAPPLPSPSSPGTRCVPSSPWVPSC